MKPFPTTAIGSFALVSGVLALLCHAWLEPSTPLSTQDLTLIALLLLRPDEVISDFTSYRLW